MQEQNITANREENSHLSKQPLPQSQLNKEYNTASERIETSLCALFYCKRAENMAETRNGQQPHSFKRKLGNTTYTVKVHFIKDTDKTFKDRVQKLIINECLEKNHK